MLQHSTLEFLRLLKENNNREWFQANKSLYEAAKADVTALVTTVIEKVAAFDDSIGHLQAKDCLFRIYRDVRFSPDKSPYKTNMGAYFTGGGKHSLQCGYYLHIEPGNQCFAGGGCYMPPAPQLKMIRQEIDYHTPEFLAILQNPDFAATFGQLADIKLKTAPKGYAKDHPHLNLLQYTSYVASHNFTDAQMHAKDVVPQLVHTFKTLKPLNDFLNRAMGI
ncbi:TIGR02453 family protein [Sphingobacteriales bacterium UPWRP_1]|nr:TIGR02453 family protein [Sphingobacteriales bacterium UPWRP_1]